MSTTLQPNSGAYRPLRVTAPEGALPQLAIGASYGCAGVWAVGGVDPRNGRRFVDLETTGGGMGASHTGPGLSGHRVHMGNTMNLPIEAVEAGVPIRIDAYERSRGSVEPEHMSAAWDLDVASDHLSTACNSRCCSSVPFTQPRGSRGEKKAHQPALTS